MDRPTRDKGPAQHLYLRDIPGGELRGRRVGYRPPLWLGGAARSAELGEAGADLRPRLGTLAGDAGVSGASAVHYDDLPDAAGD